MLGLVNPLLRRRFLIENGFVGFIMLGCVFLAVTGAEALYADMGQFGRWPIQSAWFFLVFPAWRSTTWARAPWSSNHGVHRHNSRSSSWSPEFAYWPVLILATAATVIASQAVITGAFSMTQQAIQLGLLPRMDIRRTSETQTGQIFLPRINTLLMVGVLLLVVMFQTSDSLASRLRPGGDRDHVRDHVPGLRRRADVEVADALMALRAGADRRSSISTFLAPTL